MIVNIVHVVHFSVQKLHWIICSTVIQEEWQHIPGTCYQENSLMVEAYNDPQLQPVVVMKKLDESRLFSTVKLIFISDKMCLSMQFLCVP